MPTSQREIIEDWSFDGPFAPNTALVVGVLLILGACWLVWRERAALGTGGSLLTMLLRTGAFVAVLWMLVGPTHLTIDRLTEPTSIALFIDDSESMNVAETLDPQDAVRWSLFSTPEASENPVDEIEDQPLVVGDRTAASVRAGMTHLEALNSAVIKHHSLKTLKDLFDPFQKTLRRSRSHSEKLLKTLEEELGDDQSLLVERAERLKDLLDNEIDEVTDQLALELDAGAEARNEEIASAVRTLSSALRDAERRSIRLATDLAEVTTATRPIESVRNETRSQQTANLLANLERDLFDEIAGEALIRRFRFSNRLTSINAENEAPTERDENSEILESEGTADLAPSTDLTQVLNYIGRLQAETPTSLAFVFSDGHHNRLEGPAPQEAAETLSGTPLIFVPIGNSKPLRDLVVHRINAPSAVIHRSAVPIDIVVTGYGCAGEQTRVVLRKEGEMVDAKLVSFERDRVDHRVRFKIPEASELGWQEYSVEVESLRDENNENNNLAAVAFDVVPDKLRVLLVDGQPRWEFRYLQQLFRRDKRVDFDELVFAPEPKGTGPFEDSPQLPAEDEAWNRYDVVILGDVAVERLPPPVQASLNRYVRKQGGKLIVIAGSGHMPAQYQQPNGQPMPLVDLLPVEYSGTIDSKQGYTLVLTEEARFNPAVLIEDTLEKSNRKWQKLCRRMPVYGLSEYSRPRETARTVIRAAPQGNFFEIDERTEPGEGKAFLCWHQLGPGRVAYIAAPQTWLLRFRTGDRLHHLFWGQLLRWITAGELGSGSDLVRLNTDRVRYETGQDVEVTLQLKSAAGQPITDAEVLAVAEAQDGSRAEIPLTADPIVPGRYLGRFSKLPTGAYQVTPTGTVIDQLTPAMQNGDTPSAISSISKRISIHPANDIELADTSCNLPLLEQLAARTGGQVIPPTAVSEMFRLASLEPKVTEKVTRRPLWNTWPLLLLLFGCSCGEWVLRKQKGLV